MTAALFRLAAPGSRALERMGLFVGKMNRISPDAAEDYVADPATATVALRCRAFPSKAEAVAEAQRLCRMCAGQAARA